ncbi:MAG TPA: alcohol dehydrogenase, partial [Rhodospirillaceae bacterium]|nr:alcohol dehydrogenase [Rhodospirillaceae bacterium]
PAAIAVETLKKAGVDFAIFDEIEVEPTDRSFKAGTDFARKGDFDGFVSLGGGSTIDTAKASNLYTTHPADFLAYVNAPIGEGRPVPGALKPHIACPTTFGTASECTGIAIFDLLEMEAKTGIAHAALRPSLGVLDPNSLVTLPADIVAANAFDVFSHAVESLTARPYTQRPAPANPSARPLSQGANPYSDIACTEAIRVTGENIIAGVKNPSEIDAMEQLMFAGMLALIGFGNAGCHVPHGMSYAVAGLVRDYRAAGWQSNHPMVPHGISVIVNAPAVFRFMSDACPDRHLKAAEAFGADISGAATEDGGEILAARVVELMRACDMPNGLMGVGYSEEDLPALVEKSFPQRRLMENGPKDFDRSELEDMFRNSMRYW